MWDDVSGLVTWCTGEKKANDEVANQISNEMHNIALALNFLRDSGTAIGKPQGFIQEATSKQKTKEPLSLLQKAVPFYNDQVQTGTATGPYSQTGAESWFTYNSMS